MVCPWKAVCIIQDLISISNELALFLVQSSLVRLSLLCISFRCLSSLWQQYSYLIVSSRLI